MFPQRALVFTLFSLVSLTSVSEAFAQAPEPACLAGESVQVEWSGFWYDATILSGPDYAGLCRIRYDGWSSSWDEWVGSDRLRGYTAKADDCPVGPLTLPWLAGKPYSASVVAGPDDSGECLIQFAGWGLSWYEWEELDDIDQPTLLCKSGQALSVERGGTWWDATAVSGNDDACTIHYDDWPSSWQETVNINHMRPRAGASQPADSNDEADSADWHPPHSGTDNHDDDHHADQGGGHDCADHEGHLADDDDHDRGRHRGHDHGNGHGRDDDDDDDDDDDRRHDHDDEDSGLRDAARDGARHTRHRTVRANR